MSSGSNRFRHESLEDPETITKYLDALKEGFESGAIHFSTDDRQLVLRPLGLINMDIEAKRKGGEYKLTLKFRWNDGADGRQKKADSLRIQAVDKD